MTRHTMLLAALAAGAFSLAVVPVEAKPARCYSTDEGDYACDFKQFGGDGSFTVSAPLRPTYTISITGRDEADGFSDYGNGNIPLPGPFYRSSSDRACWISDATAFEVCAY
ncbi:hypothetical protein RDV64_03200 [Acuticoccus sp. MNP-M23]|uniref:hypothetical protein n=1 Tax=Acuticoccus sp. MNP-M23 TaxID=3072793 RepID=UPI002814D3B6|nr:hypothetical protein [Acuticoccus sp. MNP-M23]WMS43425.1 hypothetical protein RDV64_03200 [Acuticoccus sp. MNP-M23]